MLTILSCGTQRKHVWRILVIGLPKTISDVAMIGHRVSPIRPVLWCLDHGRQLQLLVVRVIALLTVILLPILYNLLV